ncbi:MAG TPA: histidine phosphatase family protein [Chitinophagales bacterium]|nr:histidine phosphatase family protein [Chitinophagales bacterium]HMY23715.1 histidine phosphatase family protein [Chitinophagales bacterium]HMZ34531.1 histidine phosphatase family protein [Chitinophagales bacterium]HNB49988.1 histidine phosphatase family protein [Chitinophagales bacterium]HNC73178.1 histidine phosphatase family protein [Chitinophagales bacterium]
MQTSNTKKEIYIIRHGQTDFNVKQIVQGRGINSDINDTGIQQAKLFFEAHKEIKFDIVYTSSLKRTWQTVDSFISKKIPHLIRTNLDEIDWGIFEGVEHHAGLQKEYYDIIEEWKNGNLSVKIEGGESANDLAERLLPFIEEIKNTTAQTILVCTHGRTLRILICLLLRIDIAQMDNFDHQNTCLYHLSYDDNTFSLIKENDTTHLNV